MNNFRKTLLSTAAMGLMTFSAVASASAADVEKKMAWSGFVNRTVITGDDGENNFISHMDPVNVGQSRGRIKASAKSEAMTIGMYFEMGMTDGDMATQSASGGESMTVRHNAFYVSNSMGKLTVGHTSHAGEAYGASDVSGTSLATSYSPLMETFCLMTPATQLALLLQEYQLRLHMVVAIPVDVPTV